MAAINFLYYCSILNVQNALKNAVKDWTDANRPFDNTEIRDFVSQAFGELNAALSTGGYTLPVTNSTKTTITGAVTAADTVKAEAVADASGFSVGKTVRIHGPATGTIYNDEFVGIVLIASNTISFEYAKLDYNAGATMELCTDGYLFLRRANITGASFYVLDSLTMGQAKATNDRLSRLEDRWNSILEDLRERKIKLDGLTADEIFIETYQTDNSDADDVGPIFEIDQDF
jgi:hypothetical protein